MKPKSTRIALGITGVVLSMVAAAGAADVNIAAKASASVSGDAALAAASAALKNVEDLWEAAKKGKDMIKFNCVNDKLSTLRGLISVLGSAVANHKEAVEKEDKDAIAHEASKISIAQNNIKQLEAQAKSCKGEVARYTGSTEKTSEVDPNVSGASFTDTTATSNLSAVPGETQTRPTSASPSL